METIQERIFNCGIVPVVVIDDANDAVPAANALKAGGVDVVEITMRTNAGLQAIENIIKNCPEVSVMAGTVLTLEKCEQCIAAGARGIVSPGFDAQIVQHCLDHDIAVFPGCVTPSEIQRAMAFGLKILKFFPADVYGGTAAIKALAGPFEEISFMPTGGVNEQNVGEFLALPNVFAVGGSWICKKGDIAAHVFDKITELTRKAREAMLGFEFAHLGINTAGADASLGIANSLNARFGFPVKLGSSSNFAGEGIEVVKERYLGASGHIAIRTNSIGRAVHYLEANGFSCDPQTAKYKNDKMIAIYLKDEVGGFAIHLLQK
ncbi:MAG: bifunctional 4-hydroxy-2-oxoglutarate aldolase/2-dehydro-3-deoxy-phosphogluconate aldolase [Gammaproteobacteria bacterium]|nr:bifunctional 4-hydroxy-2-oxoglutarate aldolase/2-dehydro-3-deoxy-phosphogluconate aldolase [Gammaproteobacteria bacterium]